MQYLYIIKRQSRSSAASDVYKRQSVKQDMLNNFEAGHEVTADYTKDVIKPLRLGVCMLRMISPLL